MSIAVKTPLLLALVAAVAVFAAGCSALAPERQIRDRIAAIREAILAERVDGIFEFGTPDWVFVAPDGKNYDRDAYRGRTTKLFAEVTIESLATEVTSISPDGPRAEVWIRQTMVREEADPAGGRARWQVSYRERQEWFKTTTRGWLVARVQVIDPRREKLSPR
jgi:ketosteroid isomerase-like protein